MKSSAALPFCCLNDFSAGLEALFNGDADAGSLDGEDLIDGLVSKAALELSASRI